jgi:transcriptional regulator with XRE-family HTH domain
MTDEERREIRDWYRAIAKRIKKQRDRKGVKQTTASQLCGFSENKIGLFERCAKRPSLRDIDKIADYFGCSVDYLLGRDKKI